MFVTKKTSTKKHHPSEGMLRVLPTKKNKKEEPDETPPVLDWREQFPVKPESIDQQAASRESALFYQKKGFKKGDILQLLKKLWLPLLAAVIVGLAIGFTLMIMISKDNSAKSAAPSASLPVEIQPVAKSSVNLSALQLRFYGVQANVFNNKDGALAFQQELQQKGLPSFILSADSYRVIVGFAKDKSAAKKMAAGFKKQKIDVYAKPFSLAANKNNNFTSLDAEILNTSKSLISQVINAGINASEFKKSSLNADNLIDIHNKMVTIGKTKNFSEAVSDKVSRVFDQTLSFLAALGQENESAVINNFMNVIKSYTQAIE